MTSDMELFLQRSTSSFRFFIGALAVAALLAAPAYAQKKQDKRDLGAEMAYAATVGTPEEIALLIADGANPNRSANTEGTPALSLAAQRTDDRAEAALQALVDGGAKLEIKDEKGQTPLFYAARSGSLAGVRFLLMRGAKYYETDKSGNIARTYAHNEGHADIVDFMDQFVQGQTKSVMDAYEKRNAEMIRRQKEAYEKAAKVQTPAAQEDKALAGARASALQAARGSAHMRTIVKPREVGKEEIRPTVYELSFHSCASKYWEFTRQARQKTELTREGLRNTQEAHEVLADAAQDRLVGTFRANKKYIDAIRRPSEQQIVAQLNQYPTNVDRWSQGVGTKADMEERCGEIADNWTIVERRSLRSGTSASVTSAASGNASNLPDPPAVQAPPEPSLQPEPRRAAPQPAYVRPSVRYSEPPPMEGEEGASSGGAAALPLSAPQPPPRSEPGRAPALPSIR